MNVNYNKVVNPYDLSRRSKSMYDVANNLGNEIDDLRKDLAIEKDKAVKYRCLLLDLMKATENFIAYVVAEHSVNLDEDDHNITELTVFALPNAKSAIFG